MTLSIVIVNYNVRHFLEQALLSVRKSAEGLSVEVWVVDNNSVDDSVKMVRNKFPEVHLIINRENVGFSKANNQAIRQSESEYVLLLNPDTVIQEDTLRRCLDFMRQTPDCGGLGVRTIDGSGTFLPESKRGFPSPWVAFCKAFGLAALFPTSPTFNWYYLGHLSPDQTHECEVLVGSFMFLRRSVLNTIGLLDEAFFMYGEDIDLSYRIVKAGFKNYYFAETTIIHYKGESTKKGSLSYVHTFYNAMIIFARKHFKGEKAALFIALMKAAVWFRASLTLISSILKSIYLPILDAGLIYAGLFFLKNFWSSYYYKDPDYIKPEFLYVNAPLYILIWLSTSYISGGYDTPLSMRRLLRGIFIGTVVLAAVYGFLDIDLRSSRMVIILGALWTATSLTVLRFLIHFIKNKNFSLGTEGVKNLVIVGTQSEAKRARDLLIEANIIKNLIGTVSPADEADEDSLGSLRQLAEIVRIYRVQEVIFCGKDVAANDIMAWMSRLGTHIHTRILPESSLSIIGSRNKNTSGDLYTIDIQFNISKKGHRRNKRLFDLACAGLAILSTPILIFFIKNKTTFFIHILKILVGKAGFVGYTEGYDNDLPPLKKGMVSPPDAFQLHKPSAATIRRLNFLYAKDYDVWHDLTVLWSALRMRRL